jgi:membrane protein YqaA with SNARE-associated domain
MGLMLAAAVWGFAEATLFFVVPDVLITWLAGRELRRGLWAALGATAGALLGGLLMFAWGWNDPASALAALDGVPAIGEAMLERVRLDLEAHGLVAMFTGPLLGTPYKIYAALAGELGMGPGEFLLISVPARLLRFVLLAVAVAALRSTWLSGWPQRRFDACLLAGWASFYLAFLSLMPW